MSKPHAPDNHTLGRLFVLRSRARTADIQRRSRNLGADEAGMDAIEQIQGVGNANIHATLGRQLQNIKEELFPLLAQNMGMQGAIKEFFSQEDAGLVDRFNAVAEQAYRDILGDRIEVLPYQQNAERVLVRERGGDEKYDADESADLALDAGQYDTARMHKVSALRSSNAMWALVRARIRNQVDQRTLPGVLGQWAANKPNPQGAMDNGLKHIQGRARELAGRKLGDEGLQKKWDEWFMKVQLQAVDGVYAGISTKIGARKPSM